MKYKNPRCNSDKDRPDDVNPFRMFPDEPLKGNHERDDHGHPLSLLLEGNRLCPLLARLAEDEYDLVLPVWESTSLPMTRSKQVE